jgi:hypothetical protein
MNHVKLIYTILKGATMNHVQITVEVDEANVDTSRIPTIQIG